MARFIHTVLQGLAERRRARRRAANVRAGAVAPARTLAARLPGARAGAGGPAPAFWLGLVGALAGVAGAALIVGHARHLGALAPGAADDARALQAYQAVLPGAAFSVPTRAALTLQLKAGGVLLIAAGVRAAAPVRVDLCSQLLDPAKPRLAPLRLGYRFDDVRRWVARNDGVGAAAVTLRNVLLVADGADARGNTGAAMPEVQISGLALADFADADGQPLQLSWRSGQGVARWVSDASLGQIVEGASAQVALRQHGWLLWGADTALRLERRASAACPRAGELLVQLYRAVADGVPAKALVTAFPARGKPVSARLAPGSYLVPAAPSTALEDQALFLDLQARGMLRLSAAGRVELVPRDLALWAAADASARAAELAGWGGVRLDAAGVKLIKRLYQHADGAYLRQQVDIFNGELRLLAWRAKAGAAPDLWQARAGAAGVPTSEHMPAVAARLFAELPRGWAPWQRAAQWPSAGGSAAPGPTLTLTLALARPASGAEAFELLLAGRLAGVDGARAHVRPACSGRACPAPDAVQHLTLTPLAGARALRLEVRPLDVSTLGGQKDQQYRHLRVAAGKLLWQPLDGGALAPVRGAARVAAPVLLRDRDGVLLWADGAPTAAATAAGLAPLLGLNPQHDNSVAGMLGRLSAPAEATLSLELALQTLSQGALDCVGMRRGRWNGKVCAGGQAPPPGRRAGLVFLDAESGDVLAAAGAGAAAVGADNWAEVRDFDRVNPAGSPLRLPALQHDGGAHQSPGSTFKVISALGLEMAAGSDPAIEALLAGPALPAINRAARQRGFGFQTDAATYPLDARRAHITNYREQSLDRRAQDGRLGLAQALTYSLNTWFAWTGELSDRSLFGRPDGGAPDLQALEPAALDAVRPIVAAAHRLGFEQALRLDGGLLPADFNWSSWDALQATPSHIDTIHTRHELRQMAIGLRMQTTPLQMALASAAIGQGRVVAPRLLLALDGVGAKAAAAAPLEVRLDRIRAGMKGVVDIGTAAGAFGAPALAPLRRGLYGKTGTAPSSVVLPDGTRRELATVWFTGWLEPGSLPGRRQRIAVAAFVSHSDGSGGEHAAPVVAAVLSALLARNPPAAK
ncbi:MULTISPECIES: penicillin-binding transpeptidase domain-containing protein [unclassified Janthinobacterium]|uniref:penicillin-binding transpeptidase domain-containing protein n=1 Tax=unclassified Janthinobacterium TaxID=2610881 RepID=UPI00034CE87F|nr:MULTISPECIES: penicillin-binding transpeptidase domain-containing protein [unclassified Janthinobacterium]MEC5161111.1 cell division protein FtsI/penicillin-binding protein 2 [Janthinobacterium sp. CG_S6]